MTEITNCESLSAIILSNFIRLIVLLASWIVTKVSKTRIVMISYCHIQKFKNISTAVSINIADGSELCLLHFKAFVFHL